MGVGWQDKRRTGEAEMRTLRHLNGRLNKLKNLAYATNLMSLIRLKRKLHKEM